MKGKKLAAYGALILPLSAAFAGGSPPMKEGLWYIRTQTADSPGNQHSNTTTSLCRSHDYDTAADTKLKSEKGCTNTESSSGNQYIFESRCEVGASVSVSKSVTTTQSENFTRVETHTAYTPALYGNTEETVTQDQTFLGNCTAGMQPGDRKSDSGVILHFVKH